MSKTNDIFRRNASIETAMNTITVTSGEFSRVTVVNSHDVTWEKHTQMEYKCSS